MTVESSEDPVQVVVEQGLGCFRRVEADEEWSYQAVREPEQRGIPSSVSSMWVTLASQQIRCRVAWDSGWSPRMSSFATVLVDDRPGASVGVRFADAYLIGCPFQVVLGRRAADGLAELRTRDRRTVTEVALADLPQAIAELRG